MRESAANKVRHLLSELADEGLVHDDECELLSSMMSVMVRREANQDVGNKS